jgi:hypothetical protein
MGSDRKDAKTIETMDEFYEQLTSAKDAAPKMRAKRPDKIEVIDEIEVQLMHIDRCSRQPGGPTKRDRDYTRLNALMGIHFSTHVDPRNDNFETWLWRTQATNVETYFRKWPS